MATRFLHQTKVFLGTVDRPSGQWVAREVERHLGQMRTGLTAAKAIAWAKPDLIGDEEVATIMAVCTPREAEVLEDVVANCW